MFVSCLPYHRLNHPNLVQLIGVSEKEDALYIVTEYARNGDLHSLLYVVIVTGDC